MSAIPFTRSLGARSGVQLNYIKDDSERFVGGDSGQVFAGVARFSRGRIDKAFSVSRDEMRRLLGAPVSPSVSTLNEAMIHVYEAFQSGAQRAVISRLVPAAASLKWMVVKDEVTAPELDPVWSVSPTSAAPTTGYLLAVRHFECFNEGVRAEIHAEEAFDPDDNGPISSKWVRLRVLDLTGNLLFDFEGSLDPLAVNDSGESTYLPNVVSQQEDDLEVIVAANAAVPNDTVYYGNDLNGNPKTAARDLVYFTEGGTTYASTDVDRAVLALRNTMFPFGYVAGLGTLSTTLIAKLAPMAIEINKQVIFDISGSLSVDAAITFANQFNFDTHYVHWYWAPLRAVDPLNGGKLVFGTGGAQIGLRCRRNSQTDSNGVPPKNYPIAGKNWPLVRTAIVQIATPTDEDLEKLAKARINPVIFQAYNSGSAFVFYDSLTAAKTTADRKLIAVAEMSSQVDDWVTSAVKEYLQLPISDTIKRTTDFLQLLFEGLEAAKWLVPSAALENRSFVATVRPNAQRPKDRVDVDYWLSYDGTTRAIHVQQTISK